ncbi:MAG TPA: type 1 glutamine amidotransferase domain-containing protein [Candidatus Baltobacteraceae bacterium]|nr:type 1 glutamine amidotransferase domain-containing protein [Candidatus Baltobacteraceae bacterium]
MAKILCVVTSHSEIDQDHKTGVWFEEFAIPYEAFRKAGFDVVTVSPHGGEAPIDPSSLDGVETHNAARNALQNTITLFEAGDAFQYDAVFLPGGHGTMFDLAQNQPVKTLLSEFDAQGKVIAAVCHGPAAFVDAIRSGEPHTLVSGRRITCFTDSEERSAKFDKLVPFLLASKLREQGANVVEGADWADHVEIDGNWITGQNPQSSAHAATAVIEALKARV